MTQYAFDMRITLLVGALLSFQTAVEGVVCMLKPSYPLPVLSDGWSAQLVFGGLESPRSILWDASGSLLVVEQGKGISRLTFNDGGGTCLEVAKKTDLIQSQGVRSYSIPLSCKYVLTFVAFPRYCALERRQNPLRLRCRRCSCLGIQCDGWNCGQHIPNHCHRNDEFRPCNSNTFDVAKGTWYAGRLSWQ